MTASQADAPSPANPTRQSGIGDAALLFVFLEVSSISLQRRLFEGGLGLPMIENQFHPPHHHHGIVKYDADGTVLALNLFAERRFRGNNTDGVTLVWAAADLAGQLSRLQPFGTIENDTLTDIDGHHHQFFRSTDSDRPCALTAVQLLVADLDESIAFYRGVLGLTLLERTARTVRFATGTQDLVLQRVSNTRQLAATRFNTYLLVLHVPDVIAAEADLTERGLAVRQHGGFSDIGGTVRFTDPTGHIFCLYQPSAESLTWGSGNTVTAIIDRAAGRRARPPTLSEWRPPC